MIRVVRTDPIRVQTEALLRSVGADLEACTPLGRRIGVAAGADVLDRLGAFGEIGVGGAVVTPGGGLAPPFLIHVVIRSDDEPVSVARVAKAFRNGLLQAAQWELASLAVPLLGIGAGNLDAETSARVMCRVFDEHSTGHAVPAELLVLAANPYEEEVFRREVALRSSRPDRSRVADAR